MNNATTTDQKRPDTQLRAVSRRSRQTTVAQANGGLNSHGAVPALPTTNGGGVRSSSATHLSAVPASAEPPTAGHSIHDAPKNFADESDLEQRGESQGSSETQTSDALSSSTTPDAGHSRHDIRSPAVSVPASNNGAGHATDGYQLDSARAASSSPPPVEVLAMDERPMIFDDGGRGAVIQTIGMLQRQRVAVIRAQIRITNQVQALTRSALGWRFDMPEKERAKLCKSAAGIVKSIQAGKELAPEHAAVGTAVAAFVINSQRACEPFDQMRANVEQEMEQLAEQLPVWSWVEGVRGLGAKGLAIIVAECGDLSNYANPGKVWKRLGLAPTGSYAMVCNDGRTAEAKPKRRRSAMWTLGDSLLKNQIRATKDAEGEKTGEHTTLGEYGRVYLDRKAYEISRNPEMSKMHAHRRAQRYAEKRLLRDLWRAWRDAVAKKAA